MTYRVKAAIQFDTAANRDAAVTAIQTRLDVADVFDGTVASMGASALLLNVRFRTQLDADDIEDRLKTRLQQAGATAGRISWHRCTHDDATWAPCNTAAVGYREVAR